MSMQADVLVVGGGVTGLTAAVEAAETGASVVLAERAPYVGGRVAQMHQYFPKLCPPICGLEILLRRIRTNPRIRILTQAPLASLAGGPGSYRATLQQAPRFVNERCSLCDACTAACPVERPDDYNCGMSRTKAVYRPFNMAYPDRYVIDGQVCKGASCSLCVKACPCGAIDLAMKGGPVDVEARAVIWATGWDPYDARKLEGLGFGSYPNVITNLMMERLAAVNGPTQGKILRPSDGKPPASVAFVQCAGSRDENHLGHCSGVCCMGSLKQARYVRSQLPEAGVSIHYIDIRSPGRLEDFYAETQKDGRVELVKGKVARIAEDPATRDLDIMAEDVMAARRVTRRVQLVVLATGLVPAAPAPAGLKQDEFGFAEADPASSGIIPAGCARRPTVVATCVQEAAGAALKALQCCVR